MYQRCRSEARQEVDRLVMKPFSPGVALSCSHAQPIAPLQVSEFLGVQLKQPPVLFKCENLVAARNPCARVPGIRNSGQDRTHENAVISQGACMHRPDSRSGSELCVAKTHAHFCKPGHVESRAPWLWGTGAGNARCPPHDRGSSAVAVRVCLYTNIATCRHPEQRSTAWCVFLRRH